QLPRAAWIASLGLTVCSMFILIASRIEAAPAPSQHVGAAQSAQPRGEDMRPSRPLAPSQRLVALSPAHALAVLDGVPLGRGFVSLPASLDPAAIHELRVSAPNHVTRVLLFRGTLDTTRI